MAHRGKVYPYAFERDLSLAPGATWGLPLNYTWDGFVATGTYAALFNGQSFKVPYNGASYTYPGYMYWIGSYPGGPYGTFYLRLAYYLTHDTRFSTTTWYLDWGGFTHMTGPVADNAMGWPTVHLQRAVVNADPSQLDFTVAGKLTPRPWPA